MIVWTVEKTLDGICTALFYAFTEKTFPDFIKEHGVYQPTFGDEYKNVTTDKIKAARVKTALVKYGGEETVERLAFCLLSCEDCALTTAFDYAALTLKQRENVSEDLSVKAVSDFHYTVNKVLNERHRLKGFIRFKETKRGILYAAYSPDNDITALLCPHFIARIGGAPFVIHDIKRGKAGVSDGKRFKIMEARGDAVLELSEDEKAWENLWKNYYKAVNIKERKNLKQQDRLMPRRYRKFLPETIDF